ncbi:hypothetical protein [Chryseobacterium jejuense]|nr:hypothetical protein [Chryseobacterium jejuense]MBP2619135.1 hypothetical protein [Chryseobacterium jejuense]
MSVHKNPAPKKIIKAARNNALSKCKSADESMFKYLEDLKLEAGRREL